MDELALKNALKTSLEASLVDELLSSYREAKENFFLGGLRLNAVEGGRFCEACFRLLEHIADGKYTPLGKPLATVDELLLKFSNLPSAKFSDSIRLHMPRALRVIYDIRNKRNAAHLGTKIKPNLQDATLVCSVADWVLAEFVREYGSVDASLAQKIIEDLIERPVPIVQDINGYLKVLKPKLKASDYCLVILYHAGRRGAAYADLKKWCRPAMRSNLHSTLNRLVNSKAHVHFDDLQQRYIITATGMAFIKEQRLLVSDKSELLAS